MPPVLLFWGLYSLCLSEQVVDYMVFSFNECHILARCHKTLYFVVYHIPYFPSFCRFSVDFLFPRDLNLFQLLFLSEVLLC